MTDMRSGRYNTLGADLPGAFLTVGLASSNVGAELFILRSEGDLLPKLIRNQQVRHVKVGGIYLLPRGAEEECLEANTVEPDRSQSGRV